MCSSLSAAGLTEPHEEQRSSSVRQHKFQFSDTLTLTHVLRSLQYTEVDQGVVAFKLRVIYSNTLGFGTGLLPHQQLAAARTALH